jgi:hypothetical protein
MAKQGQHDNDSHGQRSGRNNPSSSMTITTGTPKKRETYEAQARQHKNTDPQPQAARPSRSTTDHRPNEDTRARNTSSGRSGSRSNEDTGARG